MSDERNLRDPGEYHRSQVRQPKDDELRRKAIGEQGKPLPKKTTLEETQRRAEAFTDQPDNIISPAPPPIVESRPKGSRNHGDQAGRR